jgi:hypothetical protein
MIDAQAKVLNTGSVGRNTFLQLLFCHGTIFTVAVIFRLNALPILCACILSLLLMLNIPYNLHLLEAALDRLARGLSVEPIAARPRWPLAGLFVLVNALGQEAGQQVQIERRTVAYRDQLLQQVRKAAAQEELNRLARDLHDSIKQQYLVLWSAWPPSKLAGSTIPPAPARLLTTSSGPRKRPRWRCRRSCNSCGQSHGGPASAGHCILLLPDNADGDERSA